MTHDATLRPDPRARGLSTVPELGPEATAALGDALRLEGVARHEPPALSSAWLRAALHEGVERDGGAPQAASPRSTRGATRA
ncbi:MAG: hypothetical protein ACRC50_01240 [Gaiella sp.]